MKTDYLKPYEDLFEDAYNRLFKTLKVKLSAMEQCQQDLEITFQSKLKDKLLSMMQTFQASKSSSQEASWIQSHKENKVMYKLACIELTTIE
jgi:predicted ribosome quality control (RQC) complex YloA/Tae2 family protein